MKKKYKVQSSTNQILKDKIKKNKKGSKKQYKPTLVIQPNRQLSHEVGIVL